MISPNALFLYLKKVINKINLKKIMITSYMINNYGLV
jgi:hypothetical protein